MGTLAAGVAHEINNPLMYVMTNLEFLSRHLDASGDASPRARHAVEQAREGAERVRQIVRNLRTFSRGDDDRRGPVSVTQVLESALEMAHNEIRHRARVVRDFDVVPPVEANEARLGQVFLNLLVNAAQAIPDEGPSEAHEVRVTLRHDLERRRIVAAVRDTGHGIDPEVLPRVFDPFFTTKPVGEGTGLGLAIVHGIVRSLGGDIEVESTPGSGSEFRVYLPVATQPPAPRRRSVPPPPSGARLRVLIVDDEPNLRSSLALIVGGEHDAFTEGSGRDALARVEAGERFDVILCDLMMPEVSGLDVYETLERVAPDQARRVVFLTGGAFTPRAQEFLGRVPNPRLEKPFDLDELQRLIRKVGGAAPAPIAPQ
ncbi:MAG: ATP-binding protein [Polyangiales bacterium]